MDNSVVPSESCEDKACNLLLYNILPVQESIAPRRIHQPRRFRAVRSGRKPLLGRFLRLRQRLLGLGRVRLGTGRLRVGRFTAFTSPMRSGAGPTGSDSRTWNSRMPCASASATTLRASANELSAVLASSRSALRSLGRVTIQLTPGMQGSKFLYGRMSPGGDWTPILFIATSRPVNPSLMSRNALDAYKKAIGLEYRNSPLIKCSFLRRSDRLGSDRPRATTRSGGYRRLSANNMSSSSLLDG